MPMKMYSREQAEGRIPHVVKSVCLLGIELMMDLDKAPLTSRRVEKTMYSLSGHIGHLSKLFAVIWRDEGLKRLEKQTSTPPTD